MVEREKRSKWERELFGWDDGEVYGYYEECTLSLEEHVRKVGKNLCKTRPKIADARHRGWGEVHRNSS